MEKNDRKSPAPTAEAIFNPPRLIKAKVCPGGNYSVGNRETGERTMYTAGQIVEVTEREYLRCKHSLVTLEDEAREKAEEIEAAKPVDGSALFRSFRHRLRAGTRQAREAANERKRQEYAALFPAGAPKAAG